MSGGRLALGGDQGRGGQERGCISPRYLRWICAICIDTVVGPVASLCPQRVNGLKTPKTPNSDGWAHYLDTFCGSHVYLCTLSQVPNRKGNRMCRSPDAARCERSRIQFRSSEDCSVSFKQCPISVRSRAVKEYVCTCPNLSFCPRPDRSLTVEVAARSERLDGICPHRRRMLCSLKPWRVVPVPYLVRFYIHPHTPDSVRNGSRIP